MAKKNPHVQFKQENGVIAYIFAHLGAEKPVTFNVRDVLPEYDQLPEMARNFVDYGVKQKLSDAMALPSDEATPEKKHEALVECIEGIAGGKWSQRGEGGVGGSLFAQALADVRGIPLDEARNRISTKVKEVIAANPDMKERAALDALRAAALNGDAKLKARYAELQAERAAKQTKPSVNAEGL